MPLPNNIADLRRHADFSMTINGVQRHRDRAGANAPVPGRWGDVGLVPGPVPTAAVLGMLYPPLFSPGTGPLSYQTPVAPGQPSYGYIGGNGLTYIAGTGDDNLNVFDPSGELNTSYDPAYGLFMPVERIRRFVTPIDPTGDAQVLTFDDNSAAIGGNTGSTSFSSLGYNNTYNSPFFPLINDTGDDHFGRVSFFKYFRPPGVSPATGSYPYNATNTIIPFLSAVIPDLTTNQYHGYESQRNPKLHVALDPTSPTYSLTSTPPTGYFYPINPIIAGMPYDISPNTGPPSNGLTLPIPYQNPNFNGSSTGAPAPFIVPQPGTPLPPTYGPYIFDYLASGGLVYDYWNTMTTPPTLTTNLAPPPGTATPQFFWPFAIGNMNEPDEVNLYHPSVTDLPFGPADLEWLYRAQDSDGATLSSRLQHLAPVSFTNALDGTRRRRLFSLDSWEPTSIVWTSDNVISPNYLGVAGYNVPFNGIQRRNHGGRLQRPLPVRRVVQPEPERPRCRSWGSMSTPPTPASRTCRVRTASIRSRCTIRTRYVCWSASTRSPPPRSTASRSTRIRCGGRPWRTARRAITRAWCRPDRHPRGRRRTTPSRRRRLRTATARST